MVTNESQYSHDNELLTGQRLLHLPLLVVQLMDEGVRQLARLHQPLQVVPDQECLQHRGGRKGQPPPGLQLCPIK